MPESAVVAKRSKAGRRAESLLGAVKNQWTQSILSSPCRASATGRTHCRSDIACSASRAVRTGASQPIPVLQDSCGTGPAGRLCRWGPPVSSGVA